MFKNIDLKGYKQKDEKLQVKKTVEVFEIYKWTKILTHYYTMHGKI